MPHYVFLPWRLYVVAASEVPGEKERESEGEKRARAKDRMRGRAVGVDIYPLLFSIARDKGH